MLRHHNELQGKEQFTWKMCIAKTFLCLSPIWIKQGLCCCFFFFFAARYGHINIFTRLLYKCLHPFCMHLMQCVFLVSCWISWKMNDNKIINDNDVKLCAKLYPNPRLDLVSSLALGISLLTNLVVLCCVMRKWGFFLVEIRACTVLDSEWLHTQ